VESEKKKNEAELSTPEMSVSLGWLKHQKLLWRFLLVVYLAVTATLFFAGKKDSLSSFLWGASIFCMSIALTFWLMRSAVLGGKGMQGMMLLSGAKFILFAGLLFVGLVLFSLEPVMLFAGAFVGLVATSFFWFWAAKKSASFY